MNPKMIFYPVCAQVFLTLVMGMVMLRSRVKAMRKNRARAQELADPDKFDMLLKDAINPSDNFMTLFEVPVLFFVAMICIYVLGLVDHFYFAGACIFVVSRIIHSYIHCTYNKVVHRFRAFAVGVMSMWIIWIRFSIQLFNL